MISALSSLSTEALGALAQALDNGALRLPCAPGALHHLVPDGRATDVTDALTSLTGDGTATVATAVLRLLIADRARAASEVPRLDLVWSGPEAPGSLNRDTAAVVRDLLQRARHSVLIATYALDAGEKARAIFSTLAERLDRGEQLDVSLFVNVHPTRGGTVTAGQVVAEFAKHLHEQVWPGRRLPPTYYDPRSLDAGASRASLHAKCVVIDEAVAFVTSANFTEAAHHRNVEVGLVATDADLARNLARQYFRLVEVGVLARLPEWRSEGGRVGPA